MLVREIAARYLGQGGTILVDADPKILADIGRAGPVVDLVGGPEPAQGDVVLVSLDPLMDELPDKLEGVTAQGVTVVLLLPVAAGDLPVGRLAQAACAAGLAFVELAPIEPGWSLRTVVVCRPSRRPVPVRPFLSDDDPATEDEIDLDSQGLRIGWEWGLGDARSRALEELERAALNRIGELEEELVEVQRDREQERAKATQDLDKAGQDLAKAGEDLVGAGRDIEAAREVAKRFEGRAVAEAQRRSALQQSPPFLVGRAVITIRRHPIRGSRQLLGAIRRSVRR